MSGHNEPLNLMLLRKRVGLTQRQLAEMLSAAYGEVVTVRRISAWETGSNLPKLTPEQTLRTCEILQCSLEDLVEAVTGSNTKNPTS